MIRFIRVTLTANAGVAKINSDDAGMNNLLKRADHALYQAKSQRRNCVDYP
jgi:PleD family two-component response regulator